MPARKPRGPLVVRYLGPLDQGAHAVDDGTAGRPDRRDRAACRGRRGEGERRRGQSRLIEEVTAPVQRLPVGERQPEPVHVTGSSSGTFVAVDPEVAVAPDHAGEVPAPISLVVLGPRGERPESEQGVVRRQVRAHAPRAPLGGDVLPAALREEPLLRARDERGPVGQGDPPRRLPRRPDVANPGPYVVPVPPALLRAVHDVARPDFRERDGPAVAPEDRGVRGQAVGAGVTASAVGVDGPRERHRGGTRNAVEHRLRPDFVEGDVGELRGPDAAHETLERRHARELGGRVPALAVDPPAVDPLPRPPHASIRTRVPLRGNRFRRPRRHRGRPRSIRLQIGARCGSVLPVRGTGCQRPAGPPGRRGEGCLVERMPSPTRPTGGRR